MRTGLGWGLAWIALLGVSQAQVPAPTVLDTIRLRIPATDLALDVTHNLVTLDSRSNRVARYASQYRYDSVVVVGGAGITGEGFQQPTRLRLVNRQDVYVLDYGNRRLAVLNVNLRVLGDRRYDDLPVQLTQTEPSRYLVPLSFGVGPLGDLFLLNQDDNRIYKFDATGQPVTAFGGVGYGAGQLLSPSDLVVTRSNWVIVADSTAGTVQVFDNFGTYRYGWGRNTLPPGWRRLQPAGAHVLLTAPGHVWVLNPETGRSWAVAVPPQAETAAWNANVLAVLIGHNRVVRYAYPLPGGR